MSTLSGIFPNAITPTMNPLGDPAQKAQQRRENEAAVFAPVGETETSSASQNRTSDKPGRDESQRLAYQTIASQGREKAGEAPSDQPRVEATPANDTSVRQSDDEPSAFQQQRSELQQSKEAAQQAQLEEDLKTIRELANRDREVRTHEQAHQAVGGQHAGPMSLTFEQGPDGKRYAVAGEVPIDISPVPGNPQATMEKAAQIRRAALAPAEPSSQDRAVAAQATQLEMTAQIELRQMERQEQEASQTETEEARGISEESEDRSETTSTKERQQAERAADNADQRREDLSAQTKVEIDRSLLAEQYRDRKNPVGGTLDFLV